MSANLPPPLPHIAHLHAYTPGLQPTESGWVKLNTNESPYPPSPRVAEAVMRELGAVNTGANAGASLRLYPNPASAALREAVAAYHKTEYTAIGAANVCIGNGSDDILNLLIRAYCSAASPLAHTVPSYSLYPVLVAIENGRIENIPFERDMRLPVEKLAACAAPILFLTSPNAPTGVGFANAAIERILAAYRGLLVVDEAYAPFARENAVALLAHFPNLVIVRTLSKAHALAGIRVGYALAHPDVIGILDRVRDSYNVSRLSQAAAIAAINDTAYYHGPDGVIAKIKRTRDRCLAAWRTRGWFAYDSQANFIFVEPRDARGESGPAVAKSAYDWLCAHKVLVRYFPSHPLTAPFLRISVGTDAEMAVLDQSLQSWHKNA